MEWIFCRFKKLNVLLNYSVPNALDFVEGVINLGKCYSRYHLHKRFQLGTTEITDESRIVIVNVRI